MIDAGEQVIMLFQQLKKATIGMLELDFNREGALEQLADMQNQQDQLRAKIDGILQSAKAPLSREAKSLAADCLQLQKELTDKLASCRLEAGEQLHRLRKMQQVQQQYHAKYLQVGGYFVDKQN